MPTLPAMAAVLLLCGLDTLFAGLAFYVLMPDMLSIGFITLWPVFLIALGAAVFSGAPGGVGPFELTMLALLPSQPDTALMAAILAFRAVYYAVPAVLGGLVFLSALRKAPTSPPPGAFARRFHAFDALDITGGARAELGVIRQNGGAILSCEGGRCGIVRTGQTLTALFDPLEGHSGALAVPRARKTESCANTRSVPARPSMRAAPGGRSSTYRTKPSFARRIMLLPGPPFASCAASCARGASCWC